MKLLLSGIGDHSIALRETVPLRGTIKLLSTIQSDTAYFHGPVNILPHRFDGFWSMIQSPANPKYEGFVYFWIYPFLLSKAAYSCKCRVVMERLWSYLRRFSDSTKDMTPGHRIDHPTGHHKGIKSTSKK